MKEVVFNRKNELLRVPVGKAVFFEAYGNYCYGVFPNKQKVMLPVSLSKLADLMTNPDVCGDSRFIRVGKRFIINMKYIAQVNLGNQKLVLSDFEHEGNFSLPVSKEALRQLKDIMSTNDVTF